MLATLPAFTCAVFAAPSTPACAPSAGDAVALQLDGSVPVVAGRDGAVVRFAPALHADGSLVAPAAAPQLTCTNARAVVGIAIDSRGTLFVAEPAFVRRYARGSGTELGSFAPALDSGERIAAIALLPSGAVELALARADADSKTRFAVYSAAARGDAVQPVRTFTCDAFLGPVSAISVDSRGRTYAYDDGGEILVFPAGIAGAAKPAKRLAGPATGLRPAARTAPRGSRQLAFDILGQLYAADDGAIVRLTFYSDDPNTIGSDVTASGPASKLALVRGLATDGTNVYALSVDPATHAATVLVFGAFTGGPGPAVSLTVP